MTNSHNHMNPAVADSDAQAPQQTVTRETVTRSLLHKREAAVRPLFRRKSKKAGFIREWEEKREPSEQAT